MRNDTVPQPPGAPPEISPERIARVDPMLKDLVRCKLDKHAANFLPSSGLQDKAGEESWNRVLQDLGRTDQTLITQLAAHA